VFLVSGAWVLGEWTETGVLRMVQKVYFSLDLGDVVIESGAKSKYFHWI
jgi:hypothetical protein